ncbi:MAG: nucleotidyltransferase [Polyangiaceae bacterium]|nr:nucleotidyltransferase [Polyangiaceae bacterium]
MTTIAQAFDQLRQNLELTEAEQREASRQQNVVRSNLDSYLGGIKRDFLSGSYGRRTAIRPLNDIDVFVILDSASHSDVYPPSPPETCLKKVRRALDDAYQGKVSTRLQGRSVNIEFTGTGIGYDIVPAFPAGDIYMIPDRDRRSWIKTDPERHRAACVAANERAGGKLNPLIKMAKQWNTLRGKPLRSFHIEVMSYKAFPAAPPSYAEGLQALFAFLAQRVLASCPEPAGAGPHVDAGMTSEERARARAALIAAANEVARALQLDREGRLEQAHAICRELLGTAYPERGRTGGR